MPADLQRQQDRKRKRKAILAGGVVLGLGAAVTLAAWSDDVFAQGEFDTGQFNIQANPSVLDDFSGATWADHNLNTGSGDTGPAGLSFSAGFGAMVPGTTVYSPISLRIDPTKSSNSANVSLVEASSTGDTELMRLLTFEAKTGIAPSACADGSGFAGGTNLVVAGTSVDDDDPESTGFTLSNDVASDETTPVTVCIAVTLPEQGLGVPSNDPAWTFDAPVTTTWQFNGASV
ncbi:SipW-dependent-type signal peptide-containing protein [Dietzia sp. NPDC055340]